MMVVDVANPQGGPRFTRLPWGKVALCREILNYCIVNRSFRALCDYIFNNVEISIIQVEGEEVVKMSSNGSQTYITAKYWVTWVCEILAWLFIAGVAPYYTVRLGTLIGKATSLSPEALAVWEQGVSMVPTMEEGYIETGRVGNQNTGPQRYRWVWRNGKPDPRMYFYEEPGKTPNPVTGDLRSDCSTLIPEWIDLMTLRRRLEEGENLRTMPPIIIAQDHKRDTSLGPYRAENVYPDMMSAIQYEEMFERTEDLEERNRIARERAMAHTAAKTPQNTWGMLPEDRGGHDVWKLWKERYMLLPAGFFVDKLPESGGVTREQYMIASAAFGQSAASALGFPTEMWSQAGATGGQGMWSMAAWAKIGSMLQIMITRRKAQFTSLLSSVFVTANRAIFEDNYVRMGVPLPPEVNRDSWPEIWGRDLVRVELGPPPLVTLEMLALAQESGFLSQKNARRLALYVIGITDNDDIGGDIKNDTVDGQTRTIELGKRLKLKMKAKEKAKLKKKARRKKKALLAEKETGDEVDEYGLKTFGTTKRPRFKPEEWKGKGSSKKPRALKGGVDY